MFNSKSGSRVFVSYNKITYNKEDKIYQIKRSLSAVPIHFSVSSNMVEKLQKAFIFTKGLLTQRIFKNNYHRHCVNQLVIDSEEGDSLQKSEATRISLCVIALEHSKDKSSSDYDKEISKSITDRFESKVEKAHERKVPLIHLYTNTLIHLYTYTLI
jgi:hypothetical protein